VRDFCTSLRCFGFDFTVRPEGGTWRNCSTDVALWYEIDEDFDHRITTAVINTDLEALRKWGNDNKTTFEPEKMSVMVVSQKHHPFDASGIIFNHEELSVVDDTTLVGLKIDRRMRWVQWSTNLLSKQGNGLVRSAVSAIS